ncbi:hypothetical protein CONPUDRAFT_68651 [Coniophora puteana RWD-64-598 SS2]|uniref:Uncharacterized protein n=1 Tax=Coniophora puteana (strain RWD-64-598) TaxID=741705 RepID=A0A5M3N3N2_CONPW|nr:uncharacterized protein CONPUDRAFT_68651 [Coniophora puteana RWD-64-598 SS2]EIW86029.1 hypothetical protein CONPUDRAFT_68651 [Coniophora puteana RWD-64-598 SS2]
MRPAVREKVEIFRKAGVRAGREVVDALHSNVTEWVVIGVQGRYEQTEQAPCRRHTLPLEVGDLRQCTRMFVSPPLHFVRNTAQQNFLQPGFDTETLLACSLITGDLLSRTMTWGSNKNFVNRFSSAPACLGSLMKWRSAALATSLVRESAWIVPEGSGARFGSRSAEGWSMGGAGWDGIPVRRRPGVIKGRHLPDEREGSDGDIKLDDVGYDCLDE